MNKHTPGPWTIQERADDYSEGYYVEAYDRDVCTISTAGHSDKQQLTNARPIVAAPEMLALLTDWPVNMSAEQWNIWHASRRALLAKIEGR